MMHSDTSQANAFQNPQVLQHLAQALLQNQQGQYGGAGQGLGQGAFGSGAFGSGAFGQQGGLGQGMYGQQGGWGQQRQLTQVDVSNILQQIAPILPQIVAQAQQQQYQPMAAFGGGYGSQQRQLSHHEVNEVVRQILPAILQAAQQQQGGWGSQQGFGGQGFGTQGFGGFGLGAFGGQQNQNPWQQQYGGQQFGGQQNTQQRHITPQDAQEVARQVVEAIVTQTSGQQRQF